MYKILTSMGGKVGSSDGDMVSPRFTHKLASLEHAQWEQTEIGASPKDIQPLFPSEDDIVLQVWIYFPISEGGLVTSLNLRLAR